MAVTDDRIMQALDGLSFPAKKEEVLHHAANHGADSDLQRHLQRVPNVRYRNVADLLAAIPREP